MQKWIIGIVVTAILIYSAFDDQKNRSLVSENKYNIVSAEVLAEKVMDQDQSVMAVGSSYNGKDLIKFRIVAKNKIDNSEAKRLAKKLMNEIENRADSGNTGVFWKSVNLNFEIINENDGQILYQGISNKDGGVYWLL